MCFYWNATLNGWIHFWKIDETRFDDAVDFVGIIRKRVVELWLELESGIGQHGYFYVDGIELRV